MKWSVAVLLFFTALQSTFSQTVLHCTQKLNDFAMWNDASVTIRITDHHISIQETPGIVLAIEYDSKLVQSGQLFYLYNNTTRAVFPGTLSSDDLQIVTVLVSHYKCKLND